MHSFRSGVEVKHDDISICCWTLLVHNQVIYELLTHKKQLSLQQNFAFAKNFFFFVVLDIEMFA